MNREFFHKDFFAINQDHEASEFPLKPFWSDTALGWIDRSQKDPYGGWVRGCRLRSFWLWVIVMSATYADLSDKVVLVTGGANGIGASLVRSFSEQGARVFFCDQDKKRGAALSKALDNRVGFHLVDLKKESQIKLWVRRIQKTVGTIHVLINNAASDPRMAIDAMSARQWDDLFALNLRAYYLTAQAALPSMPKGGSIINFSSITFHIGATPMTAYVATKGGIMGLTRSLAREVGPRGIRVNTLSPGWVMTERQKSEFVTPAVRRMLRQCQCVPELIQPEEIAQVALFLASEASRVLTGQEILADRGWTYS